MKYLSQRDFRHHSDKVACIVFTKDNQRLISGSHDHTAKLICLDTGRVLNTFQQHTGPVLAIALTDADDTVEIQN